MEMAGVTPDKRGTYATTETVPRFLYQPLNERKDELFTKEEIDSIIKRLEERLEEYRKETYGI